MHGVKYENQESKNSEVRVTPRTLRWPHPTSLMKSNYYPYIIVLGPTLQDYSIFAQRNSKTTEANNIQLRRTTGYSVPLHPPFRVEHPIPAQQDGLLDLAWLFPPTIILLSHGALPLSVQRLKAVLAIIKFGNLKPFKLHERTIRAQNVLSHRHLHFDSMPTILIRLAFNHENGMASRASTATVLQVEAGVSTLFAKIFKTLEDLWLTVSHSFQEPQVLKTLPPPR
ncbi:hypothetical protein K438DRAFT_2118555 [Mycena galopus ATCC 62051]|nr:hypothetical protein K438DRAFT_2118555 [Mycena galopus ATCC 62051]